MKPSGTHLCQPDCNKSCGACCGIYNYANSSRASLSIRLAQRKNIFQSLVKAKADLPLYLDYINAHEDMRKRFEVVYCCEFVAFLDEDQNRVGCLLHPLQNGGNDWRDVSFYGRELCDGHFCPSYHYIPETEKLALISICDDWYIYGLCITDIDLVREYFRHIGNRLGEAINPQMMNSPPLKKIAGDFFSWKETWSFRSEEVNRLGKYYFDGSQYMISRINYEALDASESQYDRIFVSLSSQFSNKKELEVGETMVEDNINAFVLAYQRAQNGLCT